MAEMNESELLMHSCMSFVPYASKSIRRMTD